MVRTRVVPGLVFLAFLLGGGAAAWQMFVGPFWRHYLSARWQPVPCAILSSRVTPKGELDFKFQYKIGNATYVSSNYGFLVIGTGERQYSGALIGHYPAGSRASCFVDPADPTDAVLDRDLPGRIWINSLLLLFPLIGAIGLTWWVGTLRSGPITDARLRKMILKSRSWESLDLSGSEVTDEGLAELNGIESLRELDLAGTGVTNHGMANLKGLKHLEELTLACTKIGDEGVAVFSKLPALKALTLDETKLGDKGLAVIGRMPRIEELSLSDTQVTDTGLASLQQLADLRLLYVADTPVTDAGLQHLAGLKNLMYLDLDGTRVSDAGLLCLYGMTQLEEVDLSNTTVTAAGVEALRRAVPNCEVDWNGA